MPEKHAELAFLPAALEIQERPPSPVGNVIIWTIIVLFTVAILWAVIGRVDIVAVAHGKVIPQGRSKIIQPLETGIVRGIHVENGQQVREGDLLVELDASQASASVEQLQYELTSTKNRIVRLRALLKALSEGSLDTTVVDGQVDAAGVELQKQLLQSSYDELIAQRAERRYAVERVRQTMAAATEQVQKLEATLPIIAERLAAMESLESRNLVARTQYLELKQEHIEATQDLKTQRASAASALAQIAELEGRERMIGSAQRIELLQQLNDSKKQEQLLESDLVKMRTATETRTLVAPVDGTVQQLSVFTVGGVVTPAEQLMVIVPDEQDLIVEAMVLNKDIGFVRERQVATVKLDAFPYTRYGFISGEIVTLSDDAVPNENLGLVYAANVRLDRTSIDVEGRDVSLSPGMSVTVEVKTGKRRVIQFLLSPLLRYRSESARER